MKNYEVKKKQKKYMKIYKMVCSYIYPRESVKAYLTFRQYLAEIIIVWYRVHLRNVAYFDSN